MSWVPTIDPPSHTPTVSPDPSTDSDELTDPYTALVNKLLSGGLYINTINYAVSQFIISLFHDDRERFEVLWYEGRATPVHYSFSDPRPHIRINVIMKKEGASGKRHCNVLHVGVKGLSWTFVDYFYKIKGETIAQRITLIPEPAWSKAPSERS